MNKKEKNNEVNNGGGLPSICSGTSLPGWAIISHHDSLSLAGKSSIVV